MAKTEFNFIKNMIKEKEMQKYGEKSPFKDGYNSAIRDILYSLEEICKNSFE